jgi:hypothetical protein
LSLIWSKTDYAATLTTIWAKPGLIASIRRILVITLEAATLTKEGAWATEGSSGIFHSSMIELGVTRPIEPVLGRVPASS